MLRVRVDALMSGDGIHSMQFCTLSIQYPRLHLPQIRRTWVYAEIDFSTSGRSFGNVDNAGSSAFFIDQPVGTSADNLARTLSSGSSFPLQLGASFNSFGGLVMEFGMMNSSSFTDENNLRAYLANKWGSGGCPAINSIENGHGVIATTSTDFGCRFTSSGRDCTQTCSAENGAPVGGVARKTC